MKQDRTDHDALPVSRRRALGQFASGVATVTLIPTEVNCAALARDDPIHAAIERHWTAWQMYRELADRCDRLEAQLLRALRRNGLDGDADELAALDNDPKWQAMQGACDVASDAADAAAWALVDVEPMTFAGAAALLAYAHDFVASGGTWPDDMDSEPGSPQDWNSKLHQTLAAALMRLVKPA